MQFGILGPLDVRIAGVAVPLGGAKPRLLLAVLLLHSNKVVPAESLIDLLWGDNPPRTANNVLQAHVAGLRRLLREAAPREAGRLATRGSGYLLEVEPDELDAAVFEQLGSDARSLATVDPADARELLQRALRLWRGRPLEDVDLPAELLSAVARLEELRLGTIERKLELDIQQGRGGEAAADLALLVDEHPLRERLLGLRMLALYQQGRQADALAAYRTGRRLIVAELGVEPGLELQRLEKAILKQDRTDLLGRVAALSDAAPAVGRAVVPLAADNLPAELTSFVGREAQVRELAKLVRGPTRLLTVTGIGGAGKTRVVREVGRATLGLWPDGIWLVDLTAVSTGDRLVDAVATAVGVKEQAGRPVFEAVAGFLRNRELLLILDNCEPLIDDCARLCEALLQAAPGLTILASSREPMRVGGETTWPLQPLELPGDTETDVARLEKCEAVQLLLERARAADPRRHFDADELRDLASIAARVDGLPLAIEMTAARLRSLAPAEILARLDDRFGLLTGGARTALPRHRTLRATLDWSYDLVGVPEQLMLRRFSVFAGSVGGDHATAVCAGGILAAGEVTDILGSLVDRSLVVVGPGRGSRNRYRLLDTVREYGRVRLREAGEEEVMLRRHLDWGIDLAEQAHRAHVGNEAEWVATLAAVLDELRVALGRAPGLGGDRELKLAGCLGWFWAASGRLSEGRQVTERALAGDGDDTDRARALAALGSVAGLMGDSEATLVRLEEALSLWQQLGERKEECAAYDSLGWAHFWPGHDLPSLEAFRAGLRLARELEDADLIHRLMTGECQVHVARGDVKAARPLAAELVRGAPKRDLRTAQLGQHFLADCALIEEDCLSAATQYLTSLDLALQLDDPLEATFELQGFAMAQAGLGRAREALLLGGAAEASLEALQMDLNVPFWLALLDKWLSRAREALGATADEAWQEGRSLTLEAAAGLAHHLPGTPVGEVSVDDQALG